jgi:hypothetical protein
MRLEYDLDQAEGTGGVATRNERALSLMSALISEMFRFIAI